MPVSEIKPCAYNHDTGAIDVIFMDGRKMSVMRNKIEETLDLSMFMRSKFDWLISNEPEAFVELCLSGKLESYLEWYDKSYREQECTMRKALEKHYDAETARALVREVMMYDS